MADVFSGSFGSGASTTGAIAPAFRKKVDDENDPFGLAGTQSVSNSNLFKQAAATATDQMSGEAAGFDQQANIARDAQKSAQAQAAKAKRELLMGSGLRDSGAYLNQGIVQPEDQAVRDRADLERRLSVDRQTLINQRQAQGQQTATNLLQFPASTISQGQQQGFQESESAKGRESTERIAFAGLNMEEKKLAMNAGQFADEIAFKRYATDAGFDEAATARAWQGAQNEKELGSREKIAFADLNAKESQFSRNLAQSGQQFTDDLSFKKYATDAGLTDSEAQRVWQAIQNDKEIASREKISFAGLNIEQQKLAQDAMQFTNKLDFDTWALTQNLNDNDKQRIWEATESEKSRGFNKEMQTADQLWKTGERVGTELANTIAQKFDAEAKRLLQNGDFVGQKALANMKFNHDMRLSIQDMTNEQATAKFAADLSEARAKTDFGRQKDIITFQTLNEIERMVKAGDIGDAKAKIEQDYKIALQNNDAVNVSALQQARLNMEESENQKDRALEQTRVDLAVAGVDMEKMNQTYKMLSEGVADGRYDPKTLTDFVAGVANKAGVKVTAPDPMATTKAAQKKYDDMLFQYNLSHPGEISNKAVKDIVVPAQKTQEQTIKTPSGGDITIPGIEIPAQTIKAGTVITDPSLLAALRTSNAGDIEQVPGNAASAQAFNDFFNSTTYGELTSEEKKAKATAGYLTDPVDLKSGATGDKFMFVDPVKIELARGPKELKTGTYSGGGGSQTLPAGKYRIETRGSTTGEQFFGTKRNITDTYLIGEDGKEYLLKQEIGKTEGNIISGLWAGQ